ncbi:hypothetical protein PPL_01378 [Heterostelium album PN500]|uniref:Uncharacterized protein n=1 Tax=Heterostelium pallidum (strain ATCC 26659 / Pp 5 / PN500) TaxID=670386 RepID=D3AZ38_HETP5|nr:hypothetical protein PPL_01378 [Heterostelium album PN500]EFA85595.1 hypothetical protein PPL_01378 [Heterostelium album PN500]|eukprot:XP_020437702.1 hypothetical protein PPL_01378 [Heterostelium album PN500]
MDINSNNNNDNDNNNNTFISMSGEEKIAYYNRSNEVIIIDQKPTFVVVNDDYDIGVNELNNSNVNGDDLNGNINLGKSLDKSLDNSNNNSLKNSRNNNELNSNKDKQLNESDEEKRYQIPLPNFIKNSKMMSRYADKMIPKFPKSIRDRINPFTLIFLHRNKDVRSCFGLPKIGWSTDIKPSTKTAAKKTQKLLQEQNLPPHFLHRNDPVLDNLLTEGQFERYFNIICKKKVRVLISVAILMQIFLSLFTYLKFGNYVFKRDVGISTELVVTLICAFAVIVFPKTTSRVEVVYLQILLLTNNITRIWWEDWFPPYEPSYQIFLWINFSVPTAKFWRSSITGFIGIACLVTIRLVQKYDTVTNIIVSQGGSYLLYHIAVGFGTRLNEIANKALFAEIVQANPALPAHKTYFIFERYYDRISNRFTQRFRDKEMEQGFLKFYSSESIVEVGVVVSTLATSVYYVIQDIRYHNPGMLLMFLLLRFLVIVPSTLGLIEKNQRLRYLVQNHAHAILKDAQLQQVVITTDDSNNKTTNPDEIDIDTDNNNNNNNSKNDIELHRFNDNSKQELSINNTCNNSNISNNNPYTLRNSNNSNNNNNNSNNRSHDDLSSSSNSSSCSVSTSPTQHKGKKNILNYPQLSKSTSSAGANTSTERGFKVACT